MYPCPANNFINCVLSVMNANNVNINIYDISGRLVYNSVLNVDRPGLVEEKIDTSMLSDGVYILNAITGSEFATKHFVIVR
ncbi:MAG: T9SS type A sorting domain-containing protein [bacterium]